MLFIEMVCAAFAIFAVACEFILVVVMASGIKLFDYICRLISRLTDKDEHHSDNNGS